MWVLVCGVLACARAFDGPGGLGIPYLVVADASRAEALSMCWARPHAAVIYVRTARCV